LSVLSLIEAAPLSLGRRIRRTAEGP